MFPVGLYGIAPPSLGVAVLCNRSRICRPREDLQMIVVFDSSHRWSPSEQIQVLLSHVQKNTVNLMSVFHGWGQGTGRQ